MGGSGPHFFFVIANLVHRLFVFTKTKYLRAVFSCIFCSFLQPTIDIAREMANQKQIMVSVQRAGPRIQDRCNSSSASASLARSVTSSWGLLGNVRVRRRVL